MSYREFLNTIDLYVWVRPDGVIVYDSRADFAGVSDNDVTTADGEDTDWAGVERDYAQACAEAQ